MTNYTEDPYMCRVDFFTSSGKWYITEAISFRGLYNKLPIHEAFRIALENHLKGQRLNGMTAVCLKPYHKLEHPIMMTVCKFVKEEP